MSKFTTPKPDSLRTGQRNALDRIAVLEQSFNNMVSAVQESFTNNDKNVQEIVDIVAAVVRLVGTEQVAEQLNEIRKEKAQADADAGKAKLDSVIASGEFVTSSVVTGESVVTGFERDEKGEVVHPGYVQLDYASVKPEYQSKLLAVSVGAKFDTENGRSFEVTGIYVRNPDYKTAAATV